MSTIQVLDKTFEPYLNEAAIQEKITELALQLNKDYAGKRPLFLSVLNGAFLFTADLFKQITIEAEVSFIKLASYKGTSSTGNVITAIGLDMNVKDRHIIILEDIIDTGKTLHHYLPQLESMQPASVKIAVLLNKKEALLLVSEGEFSKIPMEFWNDKYFVLEAVKKFGVALSHADKSLIKDKYRGPQNIRYLWQPLIPCGCL
jgi:hypoxanthine phosphoribosyltransferase